MKETTKPTVLVTGATGKTGAAVVRVLRDARWPVRAVVRKKDGRSDRLRQLGAEIVVADLYSVEQVQSAMEGTDRAYYCPPFQNHMIQSSIAFALAAAEAKLESVVLMSQWLSSPRHPSIMTRQTWLTDQLFSVLSGIPTTIVNPGYFADNYLRILGYAAHLGVFPVLTCDSRNAPPSNEDIARVIASILMNPDSHCGKVYRPTGPELLSVQEMIKVMEKVLKRTIRPFPMPLWLLYKAARMQGVPAFQMSSLKYYIEDHKQGAFALNAPTDHVLQVTGKPAEDFETTTRRYAELPANQRTWINFFRTLREFLVLPFSPGYNIDRYERQMDAPSVEAAGFAMHDPQWLQGHRPLKSNRLDFSTSMNR